MSYTIDEKNQERQHLLAKILNPLTTPILLRAGKIPGGRCLDIGCGQGHTTRLLAEVLEPAECIGLDYDPKLVAYAAEQAGNGAGIRFVQGNAMQLDFPDASFDVVFTRYLLIHMADPMAVIREMMRVVKPGGKVIAFEPDCSLDISYPDGWAMERMTYLWKGLFANALMGRKLLYSFRGLSPTLIEAGVLMGMESEGTDYRRIYRISAEAVEEAVIANGLMSREEHQELVAELVRLEHDPACVVFKLPDMWVIATR